MGVESAWWWTTPYPSIAPHLHVWITQRKNEEKWIRYSTVTDDWDILHSLIMQPPIKKQLNIARCILYCETIILHFHFYLQGIMFYSLLFKFNQNGLVLEPWKMFITLHSITQSDTCTRTWNTMNLTYFALSIITVQTTNTNLWEYNIPVWNARERKEPVWRIFCLKRQNRHWRRKVG